MKRIFDLVLALGIFLLFFPLFVMISIVIYCFMGRPIFLFKSARKLGKIFKFIKFRTMKNLPRSQHSDEERLTRVGHFLRKTSLDEIPSLINVIKKGEMSLVGPRPLLVKYLNLYTKRQMRRHDVLPELQVGRKSKGATL